MTWDDFFAKWGKIGGSERGNSQAYYIDLCRLVDAPTPSATHGADVYAFEYPAFYDDENFIKRRGDIDCYKADCFVAEFKQSKTKQAAYKNSRAKRIGSTRRNRTTGISSTAELMLDARAQAERYTKYLDEWPPFILAIDADGDIEAFADFARQGKGYSPYPDRNTYRISKEDLRNQEIRDRLRRIICDPMSLDPLRDATTATLEVITKLNALTRSIALSFAARAGDAVEIGAARKKAAHFVTQCVVGMFADTVTEEGKPFLQMLKNLRVRRGQAQAEFTTAFQHWSLFSDCDFRRALCAITRETMATRVGVSLTTDQLETLIACADRDWSDVEPAVFGNLIMLTLDSNDQRRRGAHFTPRAFVEQLVRSTILAPLREDWQAIQENVGRPSTHNTEIQVASFLHKLRKIRILDPACGAGNFLYVSMLALKDLEQEVLEFQHRMSSRRDVISNDRHKSGIRLERFHGRDIDEQAVLIARLTLWIGAVQWNHRHGVRPLAPRQPGTQTVIKQDALLTEVRQFGRRTLAPTPWPRVEFIVGNPPFMGAKDMLGRLNPSYTQALRDSCQGRDAGRDLSMYFWDRAAQELKKPGSRLRRFGLITSNTVIQKASRTVIARHLADQTIHLAFAIADHPWTITSGAMNREAAVRIAMTSAQKGPPTGDGELLSVSSQAATPGRLAYSSRTGVILSDLSIGIDLRRATNLAENKGKARRGVQFYGNGFVVTRDQAEHLLALSAPHTCAPFKRFVGSLDVMTHLGIFVSLILATWMKARSGPCIQESTTICAARFPNIAGLPDQIAGGVSTKTARACVAACTDLDGT